MLQDVRIALRRLAAAPVFTAAAILTLALGIGANAAIADIIAAVLVRPLPLPDPDRVVAIRALDVKDASLATISTRDVDEWAAASRTIEAFGAWRDWSFRRTTAAGRESYFGVIATSGTFKVLGVQPVLGRFFTDDEDRPGAAPVILLSEGVWRERFGGDAAILGQTLLLTRAPAGERPYTVIGIMPDLDLPSLSDVTFWAPSAADPDAIAGRHVRNRRVWARVRPAATVREARAEMLTLAGALAKAYPDSHQGWSVDVRPLVDAEVGSARQTLMFFAAAVALVLLMACANIAGLLVARAAGREREFAVRTALGGRPADMVRLVLTEAVVLGVLAGASSLVLRLWLLDAIASLGPAIPRMAPVPAAASVAMTVAISTLAAALFGVLPAWQAARVGVADAIKRGASRTTAGSLRARSWLVGVQIALAVMLLTGAAVALRTVARLLSPPAGFDPRGALVTQLYPSVARYATRDSLREFVPRLLDDIRSIPGVDSASTTSAGPLFGGQEPIEVVPHGASPGEKFPAPRFFDISPDYFRAIGAPLVDGRDFNARDAAGAPAVAIVNETLARRLWPGAHAVGQRIRLVREDAVLEVVGVVADFAKDAAAKPVEPEIYWPYLQRPRWAFYLVVRSTPSSGDAVAASVRSRLAALDREFATARISTVQSLLLRATRGERFGAFVLGVFAATALLLAALGTYGLVSYSAAQRTREIGIRISFGARPADIRRLVLRTGVRPIAAGTIVGIGGSIAATRALSSVLAGTAPPDVWTYGVAILVLGGTAVAACLVPARRATRVDPVVALGSE